MPYTIDAAKRDSTKPLIGLYAESGGGKSYSSLLLARGFVGPAGKIIMIETEGGRGEAYADPEEYPEIGGYNVIRMRDDFAPKNFGEAITAAERAKPAALIIDSGSTEWEGIGGVLDMAAQNQAAGKKSMLVWQEPKIDHQRHFMLRLTGTPIPLVILCLRAKYPMMEKEIEDRHGNKKKDWVRSTVLEPIQSDGILFELFFHGWLSRDDHALHVNRYGVRSLETVIENGKPITVETGRRLARWAAGERFGSPGSQSVQQHVTDAPKVDMEALGAEAAATAAQGLPALEKWFRGLPKPQQIAIQPSLPTLKDIAGKAASVPQTPEPTVEFDEPTPSPVQTSAPPTTEPTPQMTSAPLAPQVQFETPEQFCDGMKARLQAAVTKEALAAIKTMNGPALARMAEERIDIYDSVDQALLAAEDRIGQGGADLFGAR